MAKFGEKASEKVGTALHEMKRGELKSGTSGKKVTSRKQAIAIGLSEAREAGAKVPPPPKGEPERAAAKKSPATKASSTKTAAGKNPQTPPVAKKALATKASARKTARKKAPSRATSA